MAAFEAARFNHSRTSPRDLLWSVLILTGEFPAGNDRITGPIIGLRTAQPRVPFARPFARKRGGRALGFAPRSGFVDRSRPRLRTML